MAKPGAEISRREFALRASRVAATAAVPSLIAGGLAVPGTAVAQEDAANTVLLGPIGLEDTLGFVYGSALRNGRLNEADRRLVEILGEQSRVHARLLRAELSDESVFPPTTGEIPGLGPGTSAREYLETALGFENQVYLNLLDAIATLEPGATSLAVTGIAGSTAQHLALLRQALGRPPILASAETGAQA